MPIHKGLNGAKFLLSLVVIVLFAYMMVYADKFFLEEQVASINPIFTQESHNNDVSIELRELEIIEAEWEEAGVLQYVVQAGDSLGAIAAKFGTTTSHLKKINGIGNVSIRPGQRLIVTDEQEWFVYTMAERMSIWVFAEMYNLNKEDLMTLNYIQDETEILHDWQEIFINISIAEGRSRLLLEPERIVPRPVVTQRPVVTRSSQQTTPTRNVSTSNPNSVAAAPANATNPSTNNTNSSRSRIESRWTYSHKVQNGFYAGYCTRYAAIISPTIFGSVVDGKQNRPFGGNANQWYRNAQAAWFSVGKTPRVNAIAVYSRIRSSAGHVAVVRQIKWDEILVEEMNYDGKFVVTLRREDIKNVDIGYIYP